MDSTVHDTHNGRLGLPASGRHPVSIGHLVMGVAFLGVAMVWGLLDLGVIDTPDLRWFTPLPWVIAGAAGLTAAAVSARRRRTQPLADEPLYPAFDPYPHDPYAPTHHDDSHEEQR